MAKGEKYTKGKWEVADYLDKETGDRHLAVWSDKDRAICLVSPKGSETEEDYANAHVIAAAPDMLEALKTIVEIEETKFAAEQQRVFELSRGRNLPISPRFYPPSWMVVANMAIKKATEIKC